MDGLLIGQLASLLPLAIISLTGNPLLLAVKINRWCRNKLNCGDVFIMNLAICDFFKTVIFFASNLAPRFTYSWKLGLDGCTYMFKAINILFSVTSITTVVLTVERYYLIAKPYQQRMKVKTGLILLSFIWLVITGLLNIPTVFTFRLYEHESQLYCLSTAVHYDFSFYMEVIYLGNIVLLPSVVILVLSCKASKILLQNTKKILSDQPALSQQLKERVKRNKNTIYVLRSIAIAYTTSYIPWAIMYIYEGLEPQGFIKWVLKPPATVLFWFIVGSFCNTSLTYLVFSKEFRKEAKGTLRISKGRESPIIKEQLNKGFSLPGENETRN